MGDQLLGEREWCGANALGLPLWIGAQGRTDAVGERGELGRIEQACPLDSCGGGQVGAETDVANPVLREKSPHRNRAVQRHTWQPGTDQGCKKAV